MKQTNITLASKSAFLVHNWSKFKCFNNIPLFGKKVGIPLLQFMPKDSSIKEIDKDAIVQGLFHLLTELEDTSPEHLINTLLDGTYAFPKGGGTPVPVDIEEHCKDLAEVIELCSKVFMVHYESMFKKGGFGDAINLAQGMAGLTNL